VGPVACVQSSRLGCVSCGSGCGSANRSRVASSAAASLVGVDLLAAGRHLAAAVGEVPLGRDPIVVEWRVGVLQQRDRDLGAVAGAHRGLVRFLREPPRRVQAVDAGPSALVDVDVRLPAVDDPDAVDPLQVADLVLRGRDDVPRPHRVGGVGLDDEPRAVGGGVGPRARRRVGVVRRGVVDRADRPDPGGPRVEPVRAGGLGLFAEEVEEPARVHPEREPGKVLETRVAPQDRLARVDDEGVEPLSGREDGRGEPGDAPADDGHVASRGPVVGHLPNTRRGRRSTARVSLRSIPVRRDAPK